MSFLDYIFGSPKRKKFSFGSKSKLSRQDIIDLVRSLDSLDSAQKDLVKTELLKDLDDGGVSRWEYEQAIRKMAFRRIELGLSEIDIKNLKNII